MTPLPFLGAIHTTESITLRRLKCPVLSSKFLMSYDFIPLAHSTLAKKQNVSNLFSYDKAIIVL